MPVYWDNDDKDDGFDEDGVRYPECYVKREWESEDLGCRECKWEEECRRRSLTKFARQDWRRRSTPPIRVRGSSSSPVRSALTSVRSGICNLDPDVQEPSGGELCGEVVSTMLAYGGFTIGEYFGARRFRWGRGREVLLCACGNKADVRHRYCPACGRDLYPRRGEAVGEEE